MEANLGLFYSYGDESVLNGAEARAGAALEILRRLAYPSTESPRSPVEAQRTKRWNADLDFVQGYMRMLSGVRALLGRYGLTDRALDFGPEAPAGTGSQHAGQRFLPLGTATSYTSGRGYGWENSAGIRSYSQSGIASPLRAGTPLGGFLRGSRKSSLRIDLPNGQYRITSIVTNTPELASGRFEIRVAERDDSGPFVIYQAGEIGDKSVDALVKGGHLDLDFIPQSGSDWLVSGIVIARQVPHIGHVPLRAVTAGAYTNLSATITAPDGVRSAYVEISVPTQTTPITAPLVRDESEFSVVVKWRPGWSGRQLHYHLSAEDGAGNVARLPEKGEFIVQVQPAR